MGKFSFSYTLTMFATDWRKIFAINMQTMEYIEYMFKIAPTNQQQINLKKGQRLKRRRE